MVDKILLGHGAVGNDHPIGPANQYYAADLPQNEYDPEKAKSLLKKAGMDGLKVDLSTEELVNLITAQRNFQASAKAIETTWCKNQMTAIGPTSG